MEKAKNIPKYKYDISELPRKATCHFETLHKHIYHLRDREKRFKAQIKELNRQLSATKDQLNRSKSSVEKSLEKIQLDHKKSLTFKETKVLKPTEFYIRQETFDLLKFDLFASRGLNPRHINDVHRMIKLAYMFLKPGNKYDFTTVLIMLNAMPLDTFMFADAYELCRPFCTYTVFKKRLNRLEELGFIKYNRFGKRDFYTKRYYYITDAGREQVVSFLSECRKQRLNIKFYEYNFRRAYSLTKKSPGEKSGLARQYRALFGKSVSGEFKRAKSIDSHNKKMSETESTES